MPELSEIVYLRGSTRTGLLKRVSIASDRKEPVENVEANCLVGVVCVMIAASRVVGDARNGV